MYSAVRWGREVLFVKRNNNEGYFVVPQQAEQLCSTGFLDIEGRTGKFLAELGQYRREHIAGALGRDSQADGPIGTVFQVGQMALKIAFVPQKLASYGDIVLSGIGESKRLFGAVKKLQPDFFFDFCESIT